MSDLYMGVDPGNTTGVCFLDRDGRIENWGQYKQNEILDFLKTLDKPKVVVMENFITYGHKAQAQTGSKQAAARVIGMVNTWAKLNDIPVVMQMASVMTMAKKWSKVKMVGAHKDTNMIAAFYHVYYYMVMRRLIKPRSYSESIKEIS